MPAWIVLAGAGVVTYFSGMGALIFCPHLFCRQRRRQAMQAIPVLAFRATFVGGIGLCAFAFFFLLAARENRDDRYDRYDRRKSDCNQHLNVTCTDDFLDKPSVDSPSTTSILAPRHVRPKVHVALARPASQLVQASAEQRRLGRPRPRQVRRALGPRHAHANRSLADRTPRV